jgi:HSP20 family protein
MKKIILFFTLISSIAIAHHTPKSYNYFDDFWRDFDTQFQNFNRQTNYSKYNNFNPQTRQYFDEKNKQYILEISTGNLTKEDLKIKYENNVLIIGSEKENEQISNNQRSYSSSRFYQSVALPNDANTDAIKAEFKDHVLSIYIPKLKSPHPSGRQIKIQ